MKTMTLQHLLTRLIWLSLLPLVLLAAYLAFNSVRSTQAAQDLAAANLAANFASAVDSELQARINGLQLLASSPLANDASGHQALYQEAQGFVTHFGSHVILADLEMQMLFNTRAPFGTALPKLPRPTGHAAVPVALQTGRAAVGDIFFGPVAKEPLVALAVPGQRNGKTAFLLLTTFEAAQFQQRLGQVALPADWSLALQDGTGATIARRTPPGFTPTNDPNAQGRFAVPSRLSPWSVVLEIPPNVYRAPLVAAAGALVLLVLGTTLVGVLGGRLAGRRLARAVTALAQPEKPGAPAPAIAEIATVRALLDATTQQRASAEARLRQSELRFRLAASTGNVWDWNIVTHQVAFPEESWRALGYEEPSADSPVAMLESLLHPEDRVRWRQALRDHLKQRLPYDLDFRVRTLSGEYRWFNTRGQAQWDDNGRATYMAGVTFDITERKQLEQRNLAQLEQLRHSEAEDKRLLTLADQSRRALLNVLQDQKQAEAALHENQRLLAETEKIGKVGGWEFDIATGKQSWTPEVYHIHEVDASFDPSVETGINFYTPASRPIIERAVQRAVAHGEPFDLELEITTAKGHPRSVHTIGKVDQERRRIHGFFQDITEKKRAEEERQQIFERITDAFVALDKNWCYTYVNPKAEQLFSRQAQDLIGKHIWTEFPEGVGQPFQLAYQKAMADQQAATLEEYYPPYDCWLENRIYPSPDGLTIYFHDITQRKRAEAALHQAEQEVHNAYERFQKIFMGAPEAMSISEMQSGRLVLVNDAFCKTFGRGQAELIGHTSLELGLWSDPSRREKAVAALRAGHTLRGVEGQTRQTNGALRDVIYSAEALQLDQQEHLLLMFTDITERKRAEAALQKLNAELEQRVAERTAELVVARDRAEAADRTKSSFLATMSHELRTPLNSVIGFTGVLLQKIPGPLNAEQEKQLNFVLKAGRHLLALISDVLDISKVEAGELHLAREPFDFGALLDRVGAAFALEAGHRGLAFKLAPCPNAVPLTGDARRIEQVLNNLLSNALKFTEHGTITLACEREDHGLVVSVSDTGVGIKPEDMNKLFRPFSQIETGLSGLREGTGLGLAITKHLVEAMGGEVRVESAWGQGSCFSFTLPSPTRQTMERQDERIGH
jgi:PAS domain S-box-containing protein